MLKLMNRQRNLNRYLKEQRLLMDDYKRHSKKQIIRPTYLDGGSKKVLIDEYGNTLVPANKVSTIPSAISNSSTQYTTYGAGAPTPKYPNIDILNWEVDYYCEIGRNG